MHNVLFSLKRAFHKSVQAGLRLTRPFGLTPARFDLLYALAPASTKGHWSRQFVLRYRLGVSAPTVSKMVTSLEQLGLVVRLRDEKGRSCGVKLTKEGMERLAEAMRALLVSGVVHRRVRSFWPRNLDLNAKAAIAALEATMRELVETLGCLRDRLHDRATFKYPEFVSRAQRECSLAAAGRA